MDEDQKNIEDLLNSVDIQAIIKARQAAIVRNIEETILYGTEEAAKREAVRQFDKDIEELIKDE